MNPREFYEGVTKPNIEQAVLFFDNYRLAVNAILTIDATYGILFDHLESVNHPYLAGVTKGKDKRCLDDAAFKDHVAGLCESFRVLRDAAFAIKHGRLDGKKARLVSSADHIATAGVTFGEFTFNHDTFNGSAVFVEIENGARFVRAEYLVQSVTTFTEDMLNQLVPAN